MSNSNDGRPICETCSDHGAVGNILTAEPCPDCNTQEACCKPSAEDLALLAAGDYQPEELWGGPRPTCPKCINEPAPVVEAHYRVGDTDPVGDCEKFEAGIHVGSWFQRVACYGDSAADAEQLRDTVLAALTTPAQPADAVEVEYPEFHTEGMGCGLEDRGITDRYEAMRHGWDQAMDRCATEVVEPLAAQITTLSADVDRWYKQCVERTTERDELRAGAHTDGILRVQYGKQIDDLKAEVARQQKTIDGMNAMHAESVEQAQSERIALQSRLDASRSAVAKAGKVIDQFLPNVGKCFGIDFQLLNEAQIAVSEQAALSAKEVL